MRSALDWGAMLARSHNLALLCATSALAASPSPIAESLALDSSLISAPHRISSREFLPPVNGEIEYPVPTLAWNEFLTRMKGYTATQIEEGRFLLKAPDGWSCGIDVSDKEAIKKFDFWSGSSHSIHHKSDCFLRDCRTSGMAHRIFISNPYLEEETRARELQSLRPPCGEALVIPFSAARSFLTTPDAVFCLNDHHGDTFRLEMAMILFADPAVTWGSLEMPRRLNGALHDFIFADDASEQYLQARAAIEEYEQSISFWYKNSPLSEMSLLELARSLKKPIYAVDADECYCAAYPLHDEYTYRTRNYLWASNSPLQGVGMIFGGEHHFVEPSYGTVIDYLLHMRERPVFLIN